MFCSNGEIFPIPIPIATTNFTSISTFTTKIEHNCPITFQSSWEFLRWSRRSRSSTCLLSPPSIPRRPESHFLWYDHHYHIPSYIVWLVEPPLPLPESHCLVEPPIPKICSIWILSHLARELLQHCQITWVSAGSRWDAHQPGHVAQLSAAFHILHLSHCHLAKQICAYMLRRPTRLSSRCCRHIRTSRQAPRCRNLCLLSGPRAWYTPETRKKFWKQVESRMLDRCFWYKVLCLLLD